MGSLASAHALGQQRTGPDETAPLVPLPLIAYLSLPWEPRTQQASCREGGALRVEGGTCAGLCVHEPIWAHKAQVLGKGWWKGRLIKGPVQPLCCSSPSPPMTLAHIGSAWPCLLRAHPIPRHLPWLQMRTRVALWPAGTKCNSSCLWHCARGLALTKAHCSPPSPTHDKDTCCLSRCLSCHGALGRPAGQEGDPILLASAILSPGGT